MNTGGAAFPDFKAKDVYEGIQYERVPGMTLRDYLAAKAMQGIMSASSHPDCVALSFKSEALAKASYEVADAMLVEREKEAK